jgi:CrcB protein
MTNLFSFLLVFLGGGLGSICRFGIGLAMQPFQLRFPYATLLANGIACFVIGILTALTMNNALSNPQRWLLATGFCGGLSTFSTFTAETWQLIESGQTFSAVANLFLSLLLCFGCLLLGLKIAA